jgi:glycosyltransferase involved in cell wall biosynthesis
MIVHVIDNLYPESGGPPTVAIEIVRQQALMGRKVALLCTHAPRKPEQRALLAERWRGLDVEYVVLDDLSAGGAAGARAAIDRLRPEVVHIHCMWEALVRQMASHARKRRIPYVLSTHGMLHPFVLAQKRLKKLAYLTLFPGIISGAGELFALNREEADHIVRTFGRPSSVLPNGIAVDDYARAESGLFRRRYPAIGDRRFILFVGRLHPIKGIDKLIRSYAHARARGLGLELMVVGPEECQLAELQALANELRIQDHVHFPGALYGAEKLDAFAACTIFAHRPRFEGFGITVVEALASGKPVVTTRECKLDGSEQAGALRMVEDTDDSFGDALLEVASRPDAGRALGMQGQAWVRSTLGWEALALQAEAAYSRAKGLVRGG